MQATTQPHKTTKNNNITLVTDEKKPVETEELESVDYEVMTSGVAIISYGDYIVRIRPEEEDGAYKVEELRKSLIDSRAEDVEYHLGCIQMTRANGDVFKVTVEDMKI
jgi:hypothetical protein